MSRKKKKLKKKVMDALDLALERQRKRLWLKKVPKRVSPEKLQAYWEERDAKLLQDKKEDIKRRKKIASRLKKFESILKEEFGRRIKVVMYLDDENDALSMLTHFKPKKGQHPLDGDPALQRAFKVSGLNELMFHVGGGTYLKTMERDDHFSEIKWEPKRGK